MRLCCTIRKSPASRMPTASRRKGAALEPEVIGRLLPGAPAERVEVRLSDLPPYLVKGLLDTEDRWFYYHPGFNPIRIDRGGGE